MRQSIGSYLLEKAVFQTPIWTLPKFEKPLPNHGDDWKSTLMGKIYISEVDVTQAFKIYPLFACCNLAEYHDAYLRLMFQF